MIWIFRICDFLGAQATLGASTKKKHYKYCFMKQKWQIQIGIAQYKNVATPLSILGINTTRQHFQM